MTTLFGRRSKLDCVFCGLGYESFNSLAYHVRHQCRFAPASVVNQRDQKDAPRMANPNNKTRNASARTAPAARTKFPPFLTVADVGRLGDQATITFNGRTRFNTSQYGDQLIAECRLGDKAFSFGIKSGSGNHKALQFMGMPKNGMTVTVEVQQFDAPDGRTVEFLSIVSA